MTNLGDSSDEIESLAAIERDASDWLAAHSLGLLDGYGRRAFRVWLVQDPRHAVVYERMAAAWDDDAITKTLRDLDNEQKRTAPGGMLTAVARRLQPRRGGLVFRFAMVATVLLAIVAGSYLRTQPPPGDAEHSFATAPARISELQLADGSIVNLGADSRINVNIASDRREVALLAGEAFFAVAPDPARPFVVRAGDAHIVVHGTRFEVSLAPTGVRVSVAEGVVELIQPAAEPQEQGAAKGERAEVRTTLRQGEQLVTEPESAAAVAPIDPEVPGAWRNGRLIYRNTRLDEVIADAQRYYFGRIELASPELGALRITATFGSDDIRTMIRLLGEQTPLHIDWRNNGDIVLVAAL